MKCNELIISTIVVCMSTKILARNEVDFFEPFLVITLLSVDVVSDEVKRPFLQSEGSRSMSWSCYMLGHQSRCFSALTSVNLDE